jgi:ABC-type glycerol-3-phosphate transport system substrate-binding protein
VLESQLGVDPADLEGARVEFWHAWTGEAEQAVLELVENFNATNPWGIRVEATSHGNYDDLSAELAAAIDAGEAPDIVSVYPYQAAGWGEDRLVDLNTYVQDPEYGLPADDQADFYPVFWENDLLDNVRIGFPALRTGQVLLYNQTWAQELGFDTIPSSPEEFSEQACAAAEQVRSGDGQSDNLTGGWIISSEYPTVLSWLYAFGSPVAAPGGDGYRLDTTQVEQAFTFLRSLYEQRCAWLAEDLSVEDEFAQRGGLFASASLSSIPHQQAAFGRAGNRDRWTVIPYPSPEGEPAVSAYGPAYMLLESTPEEQLASWLFVRWMASPVNQAALAEATSSFPLRRSTYDYLLKFRPSVASQLRAGWNLLPYAQAEPNQPSWALVRWTLDDSASQLFKWYFTMKQLPATLRLLDRTVAELNRRQP